MNNHQFRDHDSDFASLDRLVDGTLEPTERSALLRHLDAQPDGWRRCALAFLEAQAWSEALHPLAAPRAQNSLFLLESVEQANRMTDHNATSQQRRLAPRSSEVPIPFAVLAGMPGEGGRMSKAEHSRSTPVQLGSILRPLALAASLAMAFGLGRSLTPNAVISPPPAPLIAAPPASETPAPARPPIENPPLLADATPSTPFNHPNADQSSTPKPNDPLATIPASVRRQLAADGFRIEPRGGYSSIRTADGRTVRVPYQSVQARFVGNRTY